MAEAVGVSAGYTARTMNDSAGDGLESIPCNLCGSRDLRLVYRMPDTLFHPEEWFDVVECIACGLGFVNPRPVPSAIGDYYPKEFYEEFEENRARHQGRYEREAAFLSIVHEAPGRKRRLLDVGCANGEFARHMKNLGWEVEGVEVSRNARPIYDFQVHRCPLPEVPREDGSFDAITAWAVLEHVHDPKAYFAAAVRLLRSGGAFVFLVTNFDSASSRYLFREDIPRHLYFFDLRTVMAYLKRSGLQLAEAHHDGTIFEMRATNWLLHLLRRLSGRPPMTWKELPETRQAWLARTGRAPSAAGNVLFALFHPLVILDRVLLPVYEAWQRTTGTYGITTYVARKPTQP